MAVAILPFEILEDGPATVAESVSEELAILLRENASFTIISTEEVKPALQSNASLKEIAPALSAQFLVTGSVYAGGARRFVALRIEDGETGDILWFQNYDYTSISSETLASYVFDNLLKVADRSDKNASPHASLSTVELPRKSCSISCPPG